MHALVNDFILRLCRDRMDCIFCRIISGEIASRMISESQHAVAMLDAYPLASGHTLVVSRRHVSKLQDLDTGECADLFELVRLVTSRVDSAMTGSTLVAIHNGKDAGQEIPHLHVHIVPREHGDSAGAVHSMFPGAKKMPESDADAVCAQLGCA